MMRCRSIRAVVSLTVVLFSLCVAVRAQAVAGVTPSGVVPELHSAPASGASSAVASGAMSPGTLSSGAVSSADADPSAPAFGASSAVASGALSPDVMSPGTLSSGAVSSADADPSAPVSGASARSASSASDLSCTVAAATSPVAGSSAATGSERRLVHGVGLEFRFGRILPTHDFLRGANGTGRALAFARSAHLRYGFRFRPGSSKDRIYGGARQGVGVACYAFGDERELGNPTVVYLYQGGRIARLAPRLTLDYEWNFGLSFGWHPYDRRTNRRNLVMGSKINACLDVGLQLDWRFSPRFSLAAGVALTHFSNGNTKLPNAGLNTLGLRVGLTGELGPVAGDPEVRRALPPFVRHMCYDVLLFGSWRRTGVALDGRMIASPEAYPVAGFNFAPMYAFGYRFRAGVSLDGVYDASANVYTEDYIVEIGGRNPGYTFYKPSLARQLALGLSARAEFVMPYFTVNVGLGVNVLHKGGDLRAFYQILALKIGMTRSSYLHVGYCLKDFHLPNFLMLGVGYRFGDRTPHVR